MYVHYPLLSHIPTHKPLLPRLDSLVYRTPGLAVIQRFFNQRSWGRALNKVQSDLHHRIITAKVVDTIMAKWREHG